jgi:hypothetical protein
LHPFGKLRDRGSVSFSGTFENQKMDSRLRGNDRGKRAAIKMSNTYLRTALPTSNF